MADAAATANVTTASDPVARLDFWWRRLRLALRHIIPRTRWTQYRIEGWERSVIDADAADLDGKDADALREMGDDRPDEQWICIWKQWLVWEWDAVHFRVQETN